jgi:hypothetical protein
MQVAGLLVACALIARADARPGKVVRVERHAHRLLGEPRLCSVVPESMQAFCYGKQPELGSRLTVLDQTRVLGVLTVDKVEPLGACRGIAGSLWTAHVHTENGTELSPADSGMSGLLDVNIDPRTGKLVKVEDVPGGRPVGPEQISAFDLDGDGRADLEFLAFTCDETGNPVTTLTNGSPDQCIELWYANGRTLEHLRTDRIGHNCY